MFRSITIITVILFPTILFIRCNQDDELPTALKGCCKNEALWVSFGNAELFLPNIFTPNLDGINDRFYPLGDSILEIIDFQIKNSLGLIVYHQSYFQENDYNLGWDGYTETKVKKGLYTYTIKAEALDGTIGEFSGRICNYPCGLDDSDIVHIENCTSYYSWICHFGFWTDCFDTDCYVP